MKKLPFVLAIPFLLCGCSSHKRELSTYGFDTLVNFSYTGKDINNELKDLVTDLSKKFDAYDKQGEIYQLNEKRTLQVSQDTFNLIKLAYDCQNNEKCHGLFNLFIKKIADSYKNDDLSKLDLYLDEMNSSDLIFDIDNLSISIIGDADIDVGAIAKGYAFNNMIEKFRVHSIDQYLGNGGSSSIILSKNATNDGNFKVGFRNINNAYIEAKECAIGVSSVLENKHHIINPITGLDTVYNDLVLVKCNDAFVADLLSTVGMLTPTNELPNLENDFHVQIVSFSNNEITYCNKDMEVKYHA